MSTLGRTEGLPRSRLREPWVIVGGQRLAVAAAVGAAVIAVLSLTAALWALPVVDAYGQEGGPISDVLPGGPGWVAGVRVGQRLVAIEPGERQEDWSMTVDMGRPVRITKAAMTAALRSTIPVALLAAAVAAVALLAIGSSAAGAAALAAIATVLGERPMMAAGVGTTSTVVACLALLAPVLWSVGWGGRRRPMLPVLGAMVALAVAWAASRFLLPDLFGVLEPVRVAATYASMLALLVVAGGRQVSAIAGGYDRRRHTDVAMLATTAVVGVLLLDNGSPALQTATAGVVVLLAYPLVRGRLWTTIDRLGVGQLRERTSVLAAEGERRRLAREIHDTSIQDLAALASSLERSLAGHAAGAESTARLRSVTDHLRGITNELSSAELEDLGLAAALSGLVARSNHPGGTSVRLVRDEGSPDDDPRDLPEEVGLAAFRIVQEAVRNAQRHSGGSAVVVRARLRREAIEVSIADDGVGLDDVAVRTAVERGHMGLVSMRQRAALVEGTLAVATGAGGTTVRFRWTR